MHTITTSKKIKYDGNGLTFCGHTRVSPRELIFELGIKALDRMDRSGTDVPREHRHPKLWWEAQVRLYGLKCSKWTIDGMYEVLAKASIAGFEVSQEIMELEKKMEKEHEEKKNKQVKDTASSDDTTIEFSESTMTRRNTSPDESNNIATGVPDAVSNASREVELLKRNAAHSKLLKSTEGPGKDISGTWQMDCPEISKQWGDDPVFQNNHMIWKIHPPYFSQSHLWCSFNQMVVEGVMRIDWKSPLEQNRWRNRRYNFVYRGRDTGDYDFVCDDEWNKGWIKFTSEHECHGEFETQFGDEEPWAFTGKKISLKVTGKRPNSLEQEYKRLGRDFLKKVTIS